jgi:hypothetical protein
LAFSLADPSREQDLDIRAGGEGLLEAGLV